jgi:hypothetical protein
MTYLTDLRVNLLQIQMRCCKDNYALQNHKFS